MTRHSKLWMCIKQQVPHGKWVPINDIYEIVEQNTSLDKEDHQWQSPSSDIPKWKRNVRNVLQYRKKTGEIKWDGAAKYRI